MCEEGYPNSGLELLDGALVDRLRDCKMQSPRITRITNDLVKPELGK